MRSFPSAPLARLRRRFGPLLVGLAAVLAFAACTDSTGPENTADYGLLFVSDPDGDGAFDLFAIDDDGTGLENVTRAPAPYYRSLSLSPDGERLAFYSDRDGCFQIWTMATTGEDPVRLTGHAPGGADRCSYHPRWSPDGARIAFATTRELSDPVWATYVMNADGSEPRNVSTPIGEGGGTSYTSPVGWSPDGRLVFHHFHTTAEDELATHAYVVNADGTALEPLFDRPGDREPAWSPDGSRIAFISDRDGEPALFVMNADGSGARKLTDHGGTDWLPQRFQGAAGNDYDPWSPDGSRIAFQNQPAGGAISQIHIVEVDGPGHVRLTDDPEHGSTFNGWSPDGSSIAFTRDRDVYVVAADGADPVNLTNSDADDHSAVWVIRR